MSKYDRNGVSKGIDTNEIGGPQECIRFQPKVYNGAAVAIDGNDFRILFWIMIKSVTADRMKNAYLREKSRQLWS